MTHIFQKYGRPPFNVVVLNGGPGVRGQMAQVAEVIAEDRGVLEHLQAADSVEGQIREVYDIITSSAAPCVHLIGFSWGAMLGYLFTAKYPALVKKLILISSGVYEAKYAENIMDTRINRLDENEKGILSNLMDRLNQPGFYFAAMNDHPASVEAFVGHH